MLKTQEPRFVAYYRVSTKEQGRSGLGIDAQRHAVAGLVLARRGLLLAEFTEIESGRNDERPRLKEARALAVKSKATLLIAKLDRLARSVSFISSLMADSRLEIEACDLPQANRMTLHIMAAVAEGEAAAISARTPRDIERETTITAIGEHDPDLIGGEMPATLPPKRGKGPSGGFHQADRAGNPSRL